MKKVTAFLLAVTTVMSMSVFLCSCGEQPTNSNSQNSIEQSSKETDIDNSEVSEESTDTEQISENESSVVPEVSKKTVEKISLSEACYDLTVENDYTDSVEENPYNLPEYRVKEEYEEKINQGLMEIEYTQNDVVRYAVLKNEIPAYSTDTEVIRAEPIPSGSIVGIVSMTCRFYKIGMENEKGGICYTFEIYNNGSTFSLLEYVNYAEFDEDTSIELIEYLELLSPDYTPSSSDNVYGMSDENQINIYAKVTTCDLPDNEPKSYIAAKSYSFAEIDDPDVITKIQSGETVSVYKEEKDYYICQYYSDKGYRIEKSFLQENDQST